MKGLGETMVYDKRFIRDTGRGRCLHFDVFTVQSAMDLDDPDRLSLPYTRKMIESLGRSISVAQLFLFVPAFTNFFDPTSIAGPVG